MNKWIGTFFLMIGFITLHADEAPKIGVVGLLNQEIISAQPVPQKIREGLYQRVLEQPLKSTYEVIPTSEGLGFSLAITDAVKSIPHYHQNLIETYTSIYGTVEIFIDDKSYILNPGDVIVIPKNTIHWVKSVSGEKVRLLVACVPGWTPEDNHVIADSQSIESQPVTQIQLTSDETNTLIAGLLGKERSPPAMIEEIPSHLYQKRLEFPTQTIYELIPEEERLGFSLALIDLTENGASFHQQRVETYTVIDGDIEVSINGKKNILHRGDVIAIPLNAVHKVRSVTGEKGRVLVSCIPGWISEDHHLVERE